MSYPLHQSAAAILSLLLATALWLSPVEAGRDALASAQGPVTVTYAIPLVA